MKTIEKILERRLIPADRYIYGFANVDGMLGREFSGYPYAISIGRHLNDSVVDEIENGPTSAYLDHYRDVNRELNDLSTALCNDLREEQINCISIVPTLPIYGEEFKPYFEKLKYKVSHKMIATRAGLGWIGKTDLFISKAFGPRLRLVSILTDIPLKTGGKPIDKSRCGTCDICVIECPAHAATGVSWKINIDRDQFFDAHKCREKCLEFGKGLKADSGVCGICIAVCPVGKKNSIKQKQGFINNA